MASALVVLAVAAVMTRHLDVMAVVVFGVLLIGAENAGVRLPTTVAMSPSFMVVVASLAAFNGRGSVFGAALVGVCGGLVVEKLRRRRFGNVAFNCAQYLLCGAAAAGVEQTAGPAGSARRGVAAWPAASGHTAPRGTP